jgi:hypothetical protein
VSLHDYLLYPLVHVLMVLSKLSQAIKHDITEVKDSIKGNKMQPSFVIILAMQMLNLCLRPREPEYYKLVIPSEFLY